MKKILCLVGLVALLLFSIYAQAADDPSATKIKAAVTAFNAVPREKNVLEAKNLKQAALDYSQEQSRAIIAKISPANVSFAEAIALSQRVFMGTGKPDDFSEESQIAVLNALRTKAQKADYAALGVLINDYLKQPRTFLEGLSNIDNKQGRTLATNMYFSLFDGDPPLAKDQSGFIRRKILENMANKPYSTVKDVQAVINQVSQTVLGAEDDHNIVREFTKNIVHHALQSKTFKPTIGEKDAFMKLLDVLDKNDALKASVAYIVDNQLTMEDANLALSVFAINPGAGDILPILEAKKALDAAGIQNNADDNLVQILKANPNDKTSFEGLVKSYTEYNEPLRLIVPPQEFVDGVKVAIRKANGRVLKGDVQLVVDKIIDGKGNFNMTASAKSKAFGDALAKAGCHDWTSLMFQGKFLEAAKYAYAEAVKAENDTAYVEWSGKLRTSIVCLDQCYNGRALDIVKWLNGDIATCPVPELKPAEKK